MLFKQRPYLISSLLFLAASNTYAANTQSFLNSVSSIGNAVAADVANVSDASIQFFNPAGLSFLEKQQIVAGAGLAVGKRTFNGVTTFVPTAYTQSGKASANLLYGTPFAYYNLPINDNRFAFGLGLAAYGGSGQVFPDSSILRYTSTKSQVVIVEGGPALSYRLNDRFSFGLGAEVSYLYTELNAMAPTGLPGSPDAKLFNSGGDFGYGVRGGFMFVPTPATKIGFAYRSRINYTPDGSSTYVVNPGTPLKTEFNTSTFHYHTLSAPTTSLGIYQNVVPGWVVMGGLDYTQWSQVRSVTLYNVAQPGGAIDAYSPLYYRDTWRVSGAVNYQATPTWLLKMGAFYDQDPTNHQIGSADAVPNTNQIFLGLGARYEPTKTFSLDLGYGHYFAQSINIGYNTPVFQQVGTYHVTNGNIVGVQGNFNL